MKRSVPLSAWVLAAVASAPGALTAGGWRTPQTPVPASFAPPPAAPRPVVRSQSPEPDPIVLTVAPPPAPPEFDGRPAVLAAPRSLKRTSTSAKSPPQPSYDWPPPEPSRPAPTRRAANPSDEEAFLAGKPGGGAEERFGGDRDAPKSHVKLTAADFSKPEAAKSAKWFGGGDDDGKQSRFCSRVLDSVFVSPLTNPFLFEDPRALTEVRGLYLTQNIPDDQYFYQGGDVSFYGLQARIAFSDWLSLTVNKVGVTTFDGGDGALVGRSSGFSEVHLGPKFTYASEARKAALAAGVIFQVPVGSETIYQDTGSLSLVPYLSVAKNFNLWESSKGSLNVMDTLGYSLGLDGDRSDFVYNSFHVDYDVGGWHKLFPLAEVNYFHYTGAGNSRPLGFEGLDLANIGATGISGRDYLSVAAGLRYKFNENFQLGGAAEFPLLNPRDINGMRLTFDLTVRY